MKSAPAALMAPASVLAALALSACASTQTVNLDADPYEDFNRQMFAFNDGLDRAVIEPVTKGYRAVTNEPVREGVTNFVSNLGEPVTFANEVLQGKIPQAAGTVGRFLVNTTIGIAGIFNPAGAMGIARTNEDFGQTLGAWGVASGPYLVLPFLGSTTPRDLTRFPVDTALDPLNYAEFEGDWETRLGILALKGLSAREGAIEAIDGVRQQIDPYTTARRFYVRNRAGEIGIEVPDAEKNPDVPDYELDF